MTESNTTTNAVNGTSPGFLLFLVFLVLKLTKVISWSWWWVTAPLWGSLALLVLFLIVAVPLAVIFTKRQEKNVSAQLKAYSKSFKR